MVTFLVDGYLGDARAPKPISNWEILQPAMYTAPVVIQVIQALIHPKTKIRNIK